MKDLIQKAISTNTVYRNLETALRILGISGDFRVINHIELRPFQNNSFGLQNTSIKLRDLVRSDNEQIELLVCGDKAYLFME